MLLVDTATASYAAAGLTGREEDAPYSDFQHSYRISIGVGSCVVGLSVPCYSGYPPWLAEMRGSFVFVLVFIVVLDGNGGGGEGGVRAYMPVQRT